MAETSWLDWLKFIAAINQSRQRGSFVNVPNTPQQTELYNFARDRVRNLPDVSAMLGPSAIYNANSSPSFDINAAREGRTAYTAASRMSIEDLMKTLQMQPPPGGGAPTTPPAAPGLSGTPGTPGSPDPFSNFPSSPNPQNMTWDDLKRYASQYGQSALDLVTGFMTGGLGMGALTAAYHAVQSWISNNKQAGFQNIANNIQLGGPGYGGTGNPQPNPRTPYDPGFAAGQNSYWNAQWNNNLATGPSSSWGTQTIGGRHPRR